VDAKQTLADRSREVAGLRNERRRLEGKLANSTSDAALVREARQLGLVKPGERLFIVKGIEAWQRAHTIKRHGR
jgi:cell division protein FtsB